MKKISLKETIIHEDDEFIVINKPAHIATLEDRSSELNILKLANEYQEEVSVCHRLDKETSGILVLAKSNRAYGEFAKLLQERMVSKTYLAVVDGKFPERKIVCQEPLHTSGRGMAKVDKRKGKASTTTFHRVFVGKKHSILQCEPLTGRFHQIRGHLSCLGFPITGDKTYGGNPLYLSELKRNYQFGKFKEELPIIKRLALHAEKIEFMFDSKKYSLTAELPKDIRVAVKLVKEHI